MTTTQDSFSRWTTDVLIGICFRVTPQAELADWVVTSASRFNDEGTEELYTAEQLREFAIEQLEDYGITEADVNSMKS